MSRRHSSGAVVSAVVVLAAACGNAPSAPGAARPSLPSSQASTPSAPAQSATAASPSPTSSTMSEPAESTVVPWADLPIGPEETPTPLPPIPVDRSVPLCRADQLAANLSGRDGASGTVFYFVALRRISGQPCRLDLPLVGLSAASTAGHREMLPIKLDPMMRVEPVILRTPTDSGTVRLAAYSRCDEATHSPRPMATRLELVLAGGVVPVAASGDNPGVALGCLGATSPIGVSRLGGPLTQPTYPPDPRSDLQISIQLPATATAGASLDYEVTLANPTAHDIALEPCPTFIQHGAAGIKDLHLLNCAQAQPISAGGSEVFAMRVAIPATEPVGRTRLWWSIATVNGATGSAEIAIVAPVG